MKIHPTSVIGDDVQLGKDVVIGPFCVLQGDVKVGDGTKLLGHVTVGDERTAVVLGKNNELHPGCVVGNVPQDLTYKGEKTELVFGDRNVIRECVTINVGTSKGGGRTRLGSDCLIMAYAHVAHDCQLGNHVVMANSCQLAGHVVMGDHVKVGGASFFNQFVEVGTHSYIAGDSSVNKDVPPFTIAQGKYAIVRAANLIGMERAGYSDEDRDAVKKSIRTLTKSQLVLSEALEKIKEDYSESAAVRELLDFLTSEERTRGLAL